MASEYKMKQGKGEQSFAKRVHWSYPTPSSNNTRDDSTHGHHEMVNTKIRLIIFFGAEDRKTIESTKKDLELTVAHIMSSLLQNLGLNEKRELHSDKARSRVDALYTQTWGRCNILKRNICCLQKINSHISMIQNPIQTEFAYV